MSDTNQVMKIKNKNNFQLPGDDYSILKPINKNPTINLTDKINKGN